VPATDLALLREVEEFLYREADLADNHCFDEWLALWTPDARYWVPCNEEQVDPSRQISVVYDDWKKLDERIYRLKGRHAHAQSPRSRLARTVTNVRLVDFDAAQGGTVSSRVVMGEVRMDRQQVWIGKVRHVLVRSGTEFKMKEKWIYFINNDTPMSNLTFIL
jgi:3-phenylpropionate/cinnamic acid dioxygenase small subunit